MIKEPKPLDNIYITGEGVFALIKEDTITVKYKAKTLDIMNLTNKEYIGH